MFDPKITDKAALSELLEVYKKDKVVADEHTSSTMRRSMAELKNAIAILEERHCDEK